MNALSTDVLMQVLDALPVRIFWKDRESRYLGCNKLFASDVGVEDLREFLGKSDFYFFHPDQAKGFRDDDADVMYSGQAKLGIVEKIVHESGRVQWVETNKLPMRDGSGRVVGVIGMYQDVTERVAGGDGQRRALTPA